MKNSVHIWVHTLKDIRDLGARVLWECVEGSWRDWYHARKYPRLASAGWRRPWISVSCLFIVFKEEFYSNTFYFFSSALTIWLNDTFICFLSFFLSLIINLCFINQVYRLIRMTSPSPINPDWRGFTLCYHSCSDPLFELIWAGHVTSIRTNCISDVIEHEKLVRRQIWWSCRPTDRTRSVDREVISQHMASEITEYDIPWLFLVEIWSKCRVWMHLEDGQSKEWITAAVKAVPTSAYLWCLQRNARENLLAKILWLTLNFCELFFNILTEYLSAGTVESDRRLISQVTSYWGSCITTASQFLGKQL
jgi:hypothetical protein